MGARKRHTPGGSSGAAPAAAAPGNATEGEPTGAPPRSSDPALSAFAAFVRGEEEKEREAKRSAKRERAEAEAHDRLVAAKDSAAAEVKRLRDRGAPAEARAAADLAYREALSALVASETGEAPAWAPVPTEGEDEGAVIEATEAAAGEAAGNDDGSDTDGDEIATDEAPDEA